MMTPKKILIATVPFDGHFSPLTGLARNNSYKLRVMRLARELEGYDPRALLDRYIAEVLDHKQHITKEMPQVA